MKRNKIIKIFEDFKEKSIPNVIKKISNIIRKDILLNGDKNYNKTYNIDGFNLDIIIDYNRGNKQPYYSNINIYDIISGVLPIKIIVKITDEHINIDYLMSVVAHEIRHVYDIYTISDDTEFNDFIKSLTIFKFKGNNEFINLVYLSLEHELIARHNMLYELYRWINITDKNKLNEIFKKSYTYDALITLKNFNSNDFIEKTKDILNFTKNFSESIGDNFDGDVHKYYKNWEEFFNKKSNEFLGYVNDMLNDVINDVQNNKTYERLCGFISYNENIGNKICYKLFNEMIKWKNN